MKNTYKNQVTSSLLYQVCSIVLSFLSVPILIQYLGSEKYGIWATVFSICMWIFLLDLGIANGVRNKITLYISKEDYSKVKEYITAGSVTLFAIGSVGFIMFVVVANLINWQELFDYNVISNEEYIALIQCLLFFVTVNFIFSIIKPILYSIQKPGLVNALSMFTNLFLVSFLLFINLIDDSGSIIYVAISYGISSLLALLLILCFIINTKKWYLIPSIKCINKDRFKPILNVGVSFFIIQIAMLVLFSTDRLIVATLLGAAKAAEYDVVFRVFSLITVIHSLIISPLWTMYSIAIENKEYSWIKSMMLNQMKLLSILAVSVLLLCVLFPYIVNIWLPNNSMIISQSTVIAMGIYVTVLSWNNMFSALINASGYLRVSVYITMMISLLNIPISVLFVKMFNFGIDGVIYATIFCLLFGAIIIPFQCLRIYKRTGVESSVWFK